MSEPLYGPIGLFLRRPKRPGRRLAIAGPFLIVISLANLSIIWIIADPAGRKLLTEIDPKLAPFWIASSVLAGILGLATGAAMLIGAAYLSGQRTKSRLFGCALVGVGLMTIAVGLYVQLAGCLPGILLLGIGGVLLRPSAKSPASLGSC